MNVKEDYGELSSVARSVHVIFMQYFQHFGAVLSMRFSLETVQGFRQSVRE
jgi:hypothetical protein